MIQGTPHYVIGMTIRECECRFCGRILQFRSKCESKIKMSGEHVHFTLLDHFYADCGRCGLFTDFAAMKNAPKHSADRKMTSYVCGHGPLA